MQVFIKQLYEKFVLDIDELQVNVPPPATTGFENTLATLMGRITYRSNDMVTNIDPDAPARQNKSLHDLDNRDESEFAKLMYVYIRAGMLEAAQEVCEASGHPWRAGNICSESDCGNRELEIISFFIKLFF